MDSATGTSLPAVLLYNIASGSERQSEPAAPPSTEHNRQQHRRLRLGEAPCKGLAGSEAGRLEAAERDCQHLRIENAELKKRVRFGDEFLQKENLRLRVEISELKKRLYPIHPTFAPSGDGQLQGCAPPGVQLQREQREDRPEGSDRVPAARDVDYQVDTHFFDFGTEGTCSIPASSGTERLYHAFEPELAIVVRNTFLDVDEPKEVARRRCHTEPSWSGRLLEG